jgi:hypothetical protein
MGRGRLYSLPVSSTQHTENFSGIIRKRDKNEVSYWQWQFLHRREQGESAKLLTHSNNINVI